MTLQQMEYIVAVDYHRHFARAAEACNVTQSTLSALIHKLELELDVQIFNRNAHPVKPTDVGKDIIEQARKTLHHASQVIELVASKKENHLGNIVIGISPSITPYTSAKFIEFLSLHHPGLNVEIIDGLTPSLAKEMDNDNIELIITTRPPSDDDTLVIPIFSGQFLTYISKSDPLYNKRRVRLSDLDLNRFWPIPEMYPDALKPHNTKKSNISYSGSHINTLLDIIDNNSGFTIIPELYVNKLSKAQKKNVRPIIDANARHEVSIVIKKDFIRQKVLNIFIDAFKSFVPQEMLNNRIRNYTTRL